MKKVIMLCLILALIVPMLCFSANAEEYSDPKDARNVPPEIQQLADEANADVIYHQLYTETLVMLCSQCSTMEEVLAQMRSSCYVAATVDTYWRYKIENGKPVSSSVYSYPASLPKQMMTQEAIRAIAPDISIENIYVLSTGFVGNAEEDAIYYKTNLGDYVYYDVDSDSLTSDGIILNADRFLEYMHQWRIYIEKALDEKGGFMGGYPGMHIDWSAYDWTSPNFDPDAPLPIEKEEPEQEFPWLIVGIGVAVLAAAAVTTVLLIRRKKKKVVSEEVNYPTFDC